MICADCADVDGVDGRGGGQVRWCDGGGRVDHPIAFLEPVEVLRIVEDWLVYLLAFAPSGSVI
eukprot:9473752-Pyramimonas_sp.AAC.3